MSERTNEASGVREQCDQKSKWTSELFWAIVCEHVDLHKLAHDVLMCVTDKFDGYHNKT